jgi:chemotaxis protein MotB
MSLQADFLTSATLEQNLAGRPVRGNRGKPPVTIIVRHEEGEEPTHHNGAWKVAYADFVTAMMAFFMLMWLLNATTEVQRTGLADYFAPTNLFGRSASGSGKPFGGKTPNDAGTSVSSDGMPQVIKGHQSPQQDVEEAVTDTPATPLAQSDAATDGASGATTDDADEQARMSRDGLNSGVAIQAGQGRQAVVRGGDYAAARLTPELNRDIPTDPTAADVARREAAAIQSDSQREQRAMEQAGAQLLTAIRRDPALQDEAGQITVDTVPEGLRIQVVDAERRPMFALGSASPTRQVRQLMQKVAPVLAALPNAVSIAGHTDSLSYRGQEKDNWDLSTDRANATRRILVEAGLPAERIRSVTGNADRDLLVPADPLNPANRRITVIVLRHAGGDRAPTAATTAPAEAGLVAAAPMPTTPAISSSATPSSATASPVAASTVTASPVAASPVAASPVAASPVAASPVAASPVAASTVAASTVTASTVTASPVAANAVTR